MSARFREHPVDGAFADAQPPRDLGLANPFARQSADFG
jgi:hypothetical protein